MVEKSGQDASKEMWKGALLPSLFVTLISSVISATLYGVPGLLGALLASITVVIFFSVSLLVAKMTKDVNPIATMALAMFSYFTKLLLMALFLITVTRLTAPEAVNRATFGASALAIAFAWLGGEVRSFLRLRLQLPLPGEKPNDGERSATP